MGSLFSVESVVVVPEARATRARLVSQHFLAALAFHVDLLSEVLDEAVESRHEGSAPSFFRDLP